MITKESPAPCLPIAEQVPEHAATCLPTSPSTRTLRRIELLQGIDGVHAMSWLDIGPAKACQGALAAGAESKQHAPQHRAGTDFAPAPHHTAFMSQTFDLCLRQQAGQRFSNTNTLDSGRGCPPDRLKPCNSNLIRGRGPLQVLVSSLMTPLSEHRCRIAPRSNASGFNAPSLRLFTNTFGPTAEFAVGRRFRKRKDVSCGSCSCPTAKLCTIR